MINPEPFAHRAKVKLVLISAYIYMVWTAVTYLLEGRIHLLHRIDVFGRFEYAIIANLITGTVAAIWLLRHYHIPLKFVSAKQLGFQPVNRRFITVIIISSLFGFGLFMLQKPVSLNPIVIANVFSQTLPTSIAEVVVCWAVVGASFESLLLPSGKNQCKLKSKNKKTTTISAIIVGAVVATTLFGVYHFAHSPPFNQLNTVLFLMIPGALTSIVYFIGRNIYATVIFHNFQALSGVMRNTDITSFSHMIYPLLIMASVSIVVLIAADLLLVRRIQVIITDTDNKNSS